MLNFLVSSEIVQASCPEVHRDPHHYFPQPLLGQVDPIRKLCHAVLPACRTKDSDAFSVNVGSTALASYGKSYHGRSFQNSVVASSISGDKGKDIV